MFRVRTLITGGDFQEEQGRPRDRHETRNEMSADQTRNMMEDMRTCKINNDSQLEQRPLFHRDAVRLTVRGGELGRYGAGRVADL